MQLKFDLDIGTVTPLSPVYTPPDRAQSEVELALAETIPPNKTKWYDTCRNYLQSPNIEFRIAAAALLPEVITDRRRSSSNANSYGKLLTIYEEVIDEQPPEVQATAARWSGLLAVRTIITESNLPTQYFTIGSPGIPITRWLYDTNHTRAVKICELLRQHKHELVRSTAIASIDYWYSQPIKSC